MTHRLQMIMGRTSSLNTMDTGLRDSASITLSQSVLKLFRKSWALWLIIIVMQA